MFKFFFDFFDFKRKKKNIYFIDSQEDWKYFVKSLRSETQIGIDTEFDWRTTYFPKICLIQISTSDKIFILDCVTFNIPKEFKLILENKSILKVFHSVRSDSTVLSKCLNVNVQNVYDIQQAEKMISKGEIQNYGFIVEKYLKISLSKSETNSNWLRRPLSESQIKYAAEDVDFLLKIFSKQKKYLSDAQLKKVFELSDFESSLGKEKLLNSRLKKKEKKYNKKEKEIFIWREKLAEIENVPPNYIFKEKHIPFLAKNDCKNISDHKKKLLRILGNSHYVEKFILNFK
tara:strand:+ start:907 stop:1770 length:864 start_codon:yes stop_codon:yes gene_type:complete